MIAGVKTHTGTGLGLEGGTPVRWWLLMWHSRWSARVSPENNHPLRGFGSVCSLMWWINQVRHIVEGDLEACLGAAPGPTCTLLSQEPSVTPRLNANFIRKQKIKHMNIWPRHIVAAWLPAEHAGRRIVLRLAGRGWSRTHDYTQQQVVLTQSNM